MDLNEINKITLSSSSIGQDVNEILSKINTNFTTIKDTINGRGLFTSTNTPYNELDSSLRTLINNKLNAYGFSLGNTAELSLTIFSNTNESIKYFNATGIPFTITGHAILGTQYLTISGEYSINSWKISVHNTPIIYYNPTTQSYCWQLGDTKTDVSAKGVKGDKGDSTSVESLKVVEYDSSLTGTNLNPIVIKRYYGEISANNWGWKESVVDLKGGTPVWCNIGNEFYSGVVSVGSSNSRVINNPVKITLVQALTTEDIDDIWDEVF